MATSPGSRPTRNVVGDDQPVARRSRAAGSSARTGGDDPRAPKAIRVVSPTASVDRPGTGVGRGCGRCHQWNRIASFQHKSTKAVAFSASPRSMTALPRYQRAISQAYSPISSACAPLSASAIRSLLGNATARAQVVPYAHPRSTPCAGLRQRRRVRCRPQSPRQ